MARFRICVRPASRISISPGREAGHAFTHLSAVPGTTCTSSTRKMSAPRRRKTSCMWVSAATLSRSVRSLSKTLPRRSVRSKTQGQAITGARERIDEQHAGPRVLREVLHGLREELVRQCHPFIIDQTDARKIGHVGIPSRDVVAITAGTAPSKQRPAIADRGDWSSGRGSHPVSTTPAFGPGDWSKTASTRPHRSVIRSKGLRSLLSCVRDTSTSSRTRRNPSTWRPNGDSSGVRRLGDGDPSFDLHAAEVTKSPA